MDNNYFENKSLILKLDVKELNSQQIRLLKSITSLLIHTMSTEEESDYFNGGQQLMKLVAQAIKSANFSESKSGQIHYGTQALEFSFDALADILTNEKLLNYDN